MTLEGTISAVCALPRDFRSQNRSMVDLVAATGYLAVRDSVTEPAIERYLRDHAADVDIWELESMDTRCAPAWAFAGSVVTRIPGGPTHTFRDRFEACAFYIARFVEEIADRLNVDIIEKARTERR